MRLDTRHLMSAIASLKEVPLWKVIRNASRDYVQGAYKATPSAQISKSQYYRAEHNGKKWYIHESQLHGGRVRNKQGKTQLRKVRVRKGWSKSTWIGAMRELGMTAKNRPRRLPAIVEAKSTTTQQGGNTPRVVISDEFHIDRFGRSTTIPAYNQIAGEGFRLAASRLVKEWEREIKERWK